MPTAPTPHTPLPPAPSTDDPANFDTEADALVAALEPFGDEMDALATNAYNNAVEAAASAAAALTSEGNAETAQGLAEDAQEAAEAAALTATTKAAEAAGSAATSAGWKSTSTTSMALTAGSKTLTIEASKQFSAGTDIKVKRTSAPTTSYAHTTVSTYNSGTGELTFTLASDRITGSGTYTDWTVELSGARGPAGTGIAEQAVGWTATGGVTPRTLTVDVDVAASELISKITRAARTSNTELVAADKGKSIEYTTGGFTQTLAACSALGAGWFVYVVNSSTGDITFDANGSETIGGVNAATTAVLKPGQSAILITDGSNLYFAGAATGFRNMEVFTSSGTFTPKPGIVRYHIEAVGGGGGGSAYGGGAAGGYAKGFANITSAQTVTIGAGGAADAAGGATSVGSIVTCNGGSAGTSTTGGAPVAGGTATFSGGLALKGQAGGGNNNGGSYPGAAGSSPFGGAGAVSNASNAGTDATPNSGSGGGSQNGVAGREGGSGLVIISW